MYRNLFIYCNNSQIVVLDCLIVQNKYSLLPIVVRLSAQDKLINSRQNV